VPPAQESCAALRQLPPLDRGGLCDNAGGQTEGLMNFLERIAQGDITPEVSRPDPAKVIAGDPVQSTWNVEQRGNLYCGIWQSTPGKWKVSYSEWEYVYIHVGHSILTDAEGKTTHLMANDSFVIRPGFAGTWEVLETTIKDYVIVG
jgi:uncharacterized cupin superfamily protein